MLVIHGTEDEVIDFSHGLAIHDKCPKAVEPLWVEVSTFRIVCYFIFMASNYLLFLYKQKRGLVITMLNCTANIWIA